MLLIWHLDGSYKYIKIAATKTVYNLNPNDVNNKNGFLYNRGYFCLSELISGLLLGVVTTLSPEYQEAMTAAPKCTLHLVRDQQGCC